MSFQFAHVPPSGQHVVFVLAAAHAAVVVDASKLPAPPQSLPFASFSGGALPGQAASSAINSRYLLLDGKPWFPVMGEFQYSRYPAANWEPEILKMKAGGIRIDFHLRILDPSRRDRRPVRLVGPARLAPFRGN